MYELQLSVSQRKTCGSCFSVSATLGPGIVLNLAKASTPTHWAPLPTEHPYPLSTPTCWAILLAWENLFKENRLNLFPLNKKNLRTEKQSGLALYKKQPTIQALGKRDLSGIPDSPGASFYLFTSSSASWIKQNVVTGVWLWWVVFLKKGRFGHLMTSPSSLYRLKVKHWLPCAQEFPHFSLALWTHVFKHVLVQSIKKQW